MRYRETEGADRKHLPIAVTIPMSYSTLSAQPEPGETSNISCIERLQMPKYPRLADVARISGSVTAGILLSTDGNTRKTTLDWGAASRSAKALISPAVDEALQRSAFKKDCGGKSIRPIFHFVLGTEAVPNNLPQSVSYGYPNEFWISVPPRPLTQ
jgi:hypothetical protein